MKKIYTSQIVVILMAILVAVSTLLPAVNFLGFKFNLLKPGDSFGSGIILMALSLFTVLACLGKRKVLTLIFALLNLATGVYQYQSLGEYKEFHAFGLYLMLASSILLVAAVAWMAKELPKRRKRTQ